MTVKLFNPNAPLLIFKCIIQGESKVLARMGLDTGASHTIIGLEPLRSAGINIDDASYATFGDATKSHYTPEVKLHSITLGNETITNFKVFAYSLPEAYGIEGVLGLDFLRHFKVTLDFGSGRLTLEPLGK